MSQQDTEILNLIMQAEVISKTNWLHAIHLLEQAGDKYPTSIEIYLSMGDVFNRQKRYQEAITSYQKALTISPTDEHLLFIIGGCYLSLGEYRMALVYFDQVQDKSPELYYNQALAYAYLGKHDDCYKNLRLLYKLVPDNLNVCYFLSEELMRLQRFDEALEILDTAERNFGKHAHLMILKAFIWNFKKVWLRTYACFQEADDLVPISNQEYLITFAQAAQKIGLYNKTFTLYNRALEINPYNSVIYEEIIRLSITLEDYQQAQKYLAKAEQNLMHVNSTLELLKGKLNRLSPKDPG